MPKTTTKARPPAITTKVSTTKAAKTTTTTTHKPGTTKQTTKPTTARVAEAATTKPPETTTKPNYTPDVKAGKVTNAPTTHAHSVAKTTPTAKPIMNKNKFADYPISGKLSGTSNKLSNSCPKYFDILHFILYQFILLFVFYLL